MPIAIDATYSIGNELSGVGIYSRELLSGLGNPGADWVKLECLGDRKTLLPDPIDTLKATEQLVKEGFQVLVYTSDDAMLAKKVNQALSAYPSYDGYSFDGYPAHAQVDRAGHLNGIPGAMESGQATLEGAI